MSHILKHFYMNICYESGKTTYECKSCSLKYSHKNVTKMRKHIETRCARNRIGRFCANPEESAVAGGLSHSDPCTIASVITISDSNECDDSGNLSSVSGDLGPPSKKNKLLCGSQKCLDKYCDRTTKIEQDLLSKKLAFAIYASKCPLSLVENDAWLDVFSLMKPKFKVPTKKLLSTTLLESAYNEMKEKVDAYIQEIHFYLSIQVNDSNDLVIIINWQPVFMEFFDTKAEHYTSDHIYKQIQLLIQKYRPERFAGIITDSASCMINAARNVKEAYPALIATTCFTHSMNLLVGDILSLKSVSELIADVITVIKTIRNSSMIKAQFIRICENKNISLTLVLPVETKWSSYRRCLQNMTELKICLQLLTEDCPPLKNLDDKRFEKQFHKISDILLDSSFWQKLQECLNLIKPIVDVLVRIKTDQPNIHTIYPLFCEIETNFPDVVLLSLLTATEREFIITKFKEQRDKFVNSLFRTAYQLDPNHNKDILHPDLEFDNTEFIDSLCEKLEMNDDETGTILADFVNYKGRSDIFSKSYLWKINDKIAPIQWWECIPSALSKIAIRILSVPATSVSIEKSLSHMNVQKMKRNRLAFDRIGKLAYIALNNKVISPKSTPFKANATLEDSVNRGESSVDNWTREFTATSVRLNFEKECSSSEEDIEWDNSVHLSDASNSLESLSDIDQDGSDLQYDDVAHFFENK